MGHVKKVVKEDWENERLPEQHVQELIITSALVIGIKMKKPTTLKSQARKILAVMLCCK